MGSVMAEPLLARILTKPPIKPTMAARSVSSNPVGSPFREPEAFYPCSESGRHGGPFYNRFRVASAITR
jgi:hypothetical protein